MSNTTNKERIEHAIGNSQVHITSVPLFLYLYLYLYLYFHFDGVTCKKVVRAIDNFSGSATSLVGLTTTPYQQQVEIKGFC